MSATKRTAVRFAGTSTDSTRGDLHYAGCRPAAESCSAAWRGVGEAALGPPIETARVMPVSPGCAVPLCCVTPTPPPVEGDHLAAVWIRPGQPGRQRVRPELDHSSRLALEPAFLEPDQPLDVARLDGELVAQQLRLRPVTRRRRRPRAPEPASVGAPAGRCGWPAPEARGGEPAALDVRANDKRSQFADSEIFLAPNRPASLLRRHPQPREVPHSQGRPSDDPREVFEPLATRQAQVLPQQFRRRDGEARTSILVHARAPWSWAQNRRHPYLRNVLAGGTPFRLVPWTGGRSCKTKRIRLRRGGGDRGDKRGEMANSVGCEILWCSGC